MKKYYASITYRSFVGIEKDIIKDRPFNTYEEALKFGQAVRIEEEGLSIYSSEDGQNFIKEY